MAIPDTSVKFIKDSMRGAPVMNRQPGTGLAVIDALLRTGWGATTALSVEVAAGVATATLTPGQTFDRHSVVMIDGATPSTLNGEARVLSTSNASITWATDAPDGPATGSITIKNAPAGDWVRVYADTNRAVYKSTHVASNGHFLWVDDTALAHMRVRGFESMTDIVTGTGPFPADAQMSGGAYWHKSTAGNDGASGYLFAADHLALICHLGAAASLGSTRRYAMLRGFGQGLDFAAGGDPWGTFLSATGSSQTDMTSAPLAGIAQVISGGSITVGGTFFARPVIGLGGADPAMVSALVGSLNSTLSGVDARMGVGPSPVDGRIYFSRMMLMAGNQISVSPPRTYVPGAFHVPQSLTGINHLDQVDGSDDLAGHVLIALNGSTTYNVSASSGHYFIDITGPWRL